MILLRSLWTHMQDSCQVVYWEALLSNHSGNRFNFILNIANYFQNGCACAFSFETILRSFGVLRLHLPMLSSVVWAKWRLVVVCISLSLIGGEVKYFWYLSAIYRNSLCVPGINPSPNQHNIRKLSYNIMKWSSKCGSWIARTFWDPSGMVSLWG